MLPSKETQGHSTVNDPELLRDVLQRWLHQVGLDNVWTSLKIREAWDRVVDEKLRRHVQLTGFQQNILEITVDSSVYYFELVNFRKAALLTLLRQNIDVEIKDIHFVCGGNPAPQ